MMPHTAGKTVAMYFGQPEANPREFLPDEAIPPIKMGDGEAPVAEEFKYRDLGSMLSKNFDDSVTIRVTCGQNLNQISADSIHEAAKGYFRDEACCA
jgi:hypothetical protein